MEKEKSKTGLSRREFLKDAGLIVGGATVGSMALLQACGGTTTATVTNTVTAGGATQTVTAGGGGTVTATVTAPGATKTVTTTVGGTSAPPPTSGTAQTVSLTTMTVNDKPYSVVNLDAHYSLAWVLRERLGLVGTKTGCNRGECGTCTVIMNGKAVYSCMVLGVEADGANIRTVEGLSDGITLSPLQQAIFNNDALQCGFCAPGFMMAAQALLDKTPKPTLDQVREALSGHICTCGNTKFYVDAVMAV